MVVDPAPYSTAATQADPIGDPFAKLDAPALPLGLLSSAIEAYAAREALAKGVVPHAPAMAALAVCAAAIPDHVRIKVKRHEPWKESARLWVALIGPPSTKKSPVIKSATTPLTRLEAKEGARWRQLKAEWDKGDKETRGDAPVPRRHTLNDTTIEAAGQVLASNTQGLLLLRDELTGWFGAMDKYASGRGAAADRAFWLQAWNGGSHQIDRVSRPSIFIENLSVSILGGIQPAMIRRVVIDMIDDGLVQRLIPITIGSADVGEDTPDLDKTFGNYEALVERLVALPPQVIKFTAEAQEVRRAFEGHAQKLMRAFEILSVQLGAFCGKLDGLFARFALIIHCCDTEVPAEHVTEETARRVDRLLREFIIPHALHFYFDVIRETGVIADARGVAGFILAHRVNSFTLGRLHRDVRCCRKRTRQELIEMLEPLELLNWITPDDPLLPRKWAVRPDVHERFAEQAERERYERATLREIILETAGRGPL